jgi:hypothetical protein
MKLRKKVNYKLKIPDISRMKMPQYGQMTKINPEMLQASGLL